MAKAPITKDMIINDVIKLYPATIAVFNRFNVDSCCGGGYSIEQTATRDGADVPALLAALDEVASAHEN